MTPFDRDNIQSFRFIRSAFDWSTGLISLVYAFDHGPELVERIQIPGAPFTASPQRAYAVQQAVRLLHLFAGVSYYKAACPPSLVVEGPALSADAVQLVVAVYRDGLAEFAYRNQRQLDLAFQWPAGEQVGQSAPMVGLGHRALVAIGGGKDSLVTIETLRSAHVAQTVTWVGRARLIQACAQETGLPMMAIDRQLAPQLAEYNRQGAWNGHVPVTAINSAILSVAALLHNTDQVVFSNERSASVGSAITAVGEVNHQWSKSWAFEDAFAHYVRAHIAADLAYYSLLRPFSELAVARRFAQNDRYDHCFSSCNRNFHLHGKTPEQRWCGECPKCHFVFLALAPFMAKHRLVAIFAGRNLLDEPRFASAFDALIAYQRPKPFECVGDVQESRAALMHLTKDPAWQSDALVSRFAREILPTFDRQSLSLDPLLHASGDHHIPPAIWPHVNALFRD